MSLPKNNETRKKTDVELAKDIDNYEKELLTLAETKYGRKQSLKKLIARIKTILSERKLAKKGKTF